MDSIIIKIRSLYNEMGRSEKKIADWILEHPENIVQLSISELAVKCGCGEATIVRFSKRLGLTGFQALKISIAQETTSFSSGCADIQSTDSCFDIYAKRTSDIVLALEKTKSVLNPEKLEAAAKAVMNAKRILILGLGNSASVAADAQHKFLRAGLNSVVYSDNHMQAIAASHLHVGDVALGISHSGSSVDVVEALKLAKSSGAMTISITNYGSSPIVKASDIVLYTNAEETKHTILAMSSRIAQLAIIDTIYTYILFNSDNTAIKAIQETEKALQSKKY